MSGFDAYDGNPSMYKVHKFMNLGKPEMDYFITQVAMAAASFGVAKEDIAVVGKALGDTFNMRCSAPAEVIKGKGAQAQAICIKSGCEEAKDAKCDAYAEAVAPGNCTMTSTSSGSMMPTGTSTSSMNGGGSGSGSATTTPTSTSTNPPKSADGNVNSFGLAAIAAALAAYAL